MDILLILSTNYHTSKWVLSGNSYDGLNWLDEQPKPTEEELEAQWGDAQYKSEYTLVQETRRQAYVLTSDPLFFGFQRGDNTEQEWLDAVQAVKDANPYPEAPTA